MELFLIVLVIIVIIVAMRTIKKQKEQINYLRIDARRYELVKRYESSDNFLDLLRRSNYEVLDYVIVERLRNYLRIALYHKRTFLKTYAEIETFNGEMFKFVKETFLQIVKEKSSSHWASMALNDAIAKKYDSTKIESAIKELNDIEFSSSFYRLLAMYLEKYLQNNIHLTQDEKLVLGEEISRLRLLIPKNKQ